MGRLAGSASIKRRRGVFGFVGQGTDEANSPKVPRRRRAIRGIPARRFQEFAAKLPTATGIREHPLRRDDTPWQRNDARRRRPLLWSFPPRRRSSLSPCQMRGRLDKVLGEVEVPTGTG